MNSTTCTIDGLLAAWTITDLSADLGVKYETARKMRERGSVSPAHWPKLLDAARARGFAISYDDLVAMRAAKITGSVQ